MNVIDVTQLPTNEDNLPLYRHHMEVDVTNAVINRFQFTGLMRPAGPDRADARLEGELREFRKDALRYNASQQVEEWRVNIIVNLKFFDQHSDQPVWEETGFAGNTTYVALGSNAESESQAIDRAVTDLARRIVERTVESW